MPKMLSWAKKISGRSSPKKAGKEPVVDKDGNPEKTHDVESKNMADNKSSCNEKISGSEKENSLKEQSRLNYANGKETQNKEHSSDRQPSPPNQHSPSKSPSPEKTLPSVKKTPSFAKRFASFRIPGRKSPDKSRSKSRSPELETVPKDNSSEKSAQNESICKTACDPINTSDQNLQINRLSKFSSEHVTENGSEHEKTLVSNQETLQSTHSDTDRHSNTDRLGVPETQTATEENSSAGLSKFGRRSISEKLYGEVIKEFDKMRTTRSRILSSDCCTVSEENESPRSETQKEHTTPHSDSKDTEQFKTISSECQNKNTIGGTVQLRYSSLTVKKTEPPAERNDTAGDKLLSTQELCKTESTPSNDSKRCESEEMKQQNIPESCLSKDLRGESKQEYKITSASSVAQISPKPVFSSLVPTAETTSSLHVLTKKNPDVDGKTSLYPLSENAGLVTSGSSAVKDDTPHLTSNGPENMKDPTPESSPSSKLPPYKITSPFSVEQISSPKPVFSSLVPTAETTSSLHVLTEKNPDVDGKTSLCPLSENTGLVTSGSSAVKDDTPHLTSNDPENMKDPTPESSPSSKLPPSVTNELSISSTLSTSPVSVECAASCVDTSAGIPLESALHESGITKEDPEFDNTDKSLATSAGASCVTEEKNSPSVCVNNEDAATDNIQGEDSPSPENPQAGDTSEPSSVEVNNIKNVNPVPSVRLSKLPKPLDETTPSLAEESSTPSETPLPVCDRPSLSNCNLSSSDNILNTEKDPVYKNSLTEEESFPAHSSLANGKEEQELSSSKSSEEADAINISCHQTHNKETENIRKNLSSDELQVSLETGNTTDKEVKNNSSSSSDEPSQIESKASSYSLVHTDPEVSVISCYNLDESSESSKCAPSRADTCDSIDSFILPCSDKDASTEINTQNNVTSPTTPQRSLHEKMYRSSEEVSSQPAYMFRHKENGLNKEISKTSTESCECPSSGEGGSLPASPSVPRRRKKSLPFPATRSLQTLSPTCSAKLSVTGETQNRERSNTLGKAPPRPPLPASVYSPHHLSPSSRSNTSLSTQNYPQGKQVESTNPFDSDDDHESAGDKPGVATASQNSDRKISLNPFDSDEDEDTQEDNNNQSINTKIQMPPPGYNPFDEDDEDVNEKDVSSAAPSSATKYNTLSPASTVNRESFIRSPTSTRNLDDSLASPRSQSSRSTYESPSRNPFEEDEDESADFNDTPLLRQSLARQSLAVRSSSPFQREGVRASLPSAGRGLSSKKKRQAPLPPGYRPSPATTPLPPRNTMMLHGESSISLYDAGSLRKNSMSSVSTLSLSSPKKTPPPRPPPPKVKSVSLAQL